MNYSEKEVLKKIKKFKGGRAATKKMIPLIKQTNFSVESEPIKNLKNEATDGREIADHHKNGYGSIYSIEKAILLAQKSLLE